MIQDFQVFLNIVGQGLSWFFGLELSDWWAALVQKGTDKFWVAGIVIFLGLILVGGFFFWGLRFLSYCLIASYLGLILAGGESPSVWTMTAAILYVTVTLAAGSGKRGKHFKMAGSSALSVLILSGVLLVASAQIGVPLLQKAFGDVLPLRTRIQQTSLLHVLNQFLPEELKFQDGTGEYEGGSLEVQSDGPDFSGRTVVTVESDQKPENPVYWSRYMGNLYTGYSFNDEGDLDDPKNRYNIQYPKRKLAELKAFCDANPQETPQDIVDFIVNTLRDNTVYNLQVDSPLDGKDFIEYFFFEKKEGYCIHYAATAVMMLRMYGIPARYVTGFLIPPSLFYLNDEGVWQADVPDDHAHAWAEAYIDGRWVRVETTPSGGFTADVQEAMGEEPGSENATEMETQTEGASPEAGTGLAAETEGGSENAVSSGNENQTENGGAAGTLGELEASGGLPENIGPSWVFLPVVLLLAMVLICIGLFIRRFMILEKRKKASVQEIFAAIFEVLTVGGLPASYSLLTENLEDEILERFVWIQEPELHRVLEIVLRTTYGPETATEEERREVQNLYRAICRQLGREQKGMSRFAFYLIDVWI